MSEWITYSFMQKMYKKAWFYVPRAYFIHVLFNSDKFAFIRQVSIIVAVNRNTKGWRGVPHIAHWKRTVVARREIVCSWKRACNTTFLCSWKRVCDTSRTDQVCSLTTTHGLCYTYVVIAIVGFCQPWRMGDGGSPPIWNPSNWYYHSS